MYIPNPPSDQKFKVPALVTLTNEEKAVVGDNKVIATPHNIFVESEGFPIVYDRKSLTLLLETPKEVATVEGPAKDTSDTPAIEYTDLKAADLIAFINSTDDIDILKQIQDSDKRKGVLKAVGKKLG